MGYVIVDGAFVVHIETAETPLQALQQYMDNWRRAPSRRIEIIRVTGRSSYSCDSSDSSNSRD